MPTEKEIIGLIAKEKLFFRPLSISMLKIQPDIQKNCRADALVEVCWGNKKIEFIVEIKSSSTPKAFQAAINQLKCSTFPRNIKPMLIMPFLDDKQLEELEREGISGIDLCGNGVVIVPGSFAVYRSGGKNLFPSSSPIKNIYRKNSSMVARAFLSRPRYKTVQEIRDEVNNLNMLVNRWSKNPMNLSTVSKSLKTLKDDLIIERLNTIRLLQPEKILEKLLASFSPIVTDNKVRLKIVDQNETVAQILMRLSREASLPIIATGTSSAAQYAVMQRGAMLSVYCPSVEQIVKLLPKNISDRFPNLEIIETEDETVFFDAQEKADFWWASSVQSYLELMNGDKRDQETAEQMKTYILNKANQESQ